MTPRLNDFTVEELALELARVDVAAAARQARESRRLELRADDRMVIAKRRGVSYARIGAAVGLTKDQVRHRIERRT